MSIISEIVDNYKTPIYVFSESMITEQVRKLRSDESHNHGICFAIKSNPFIISLIEKHVDRFEACSHGEYKILIENGIDTERIVYSGVNKYSDDLERIIANGFKGIVTIESIRQWEDLVTFCSKYSMNVKAIFRLTSGNQFGMTDKEIMTCILNNNCKFINIRGIHFYAGTQKKNIDEIKNDICLIEKTCENIKSNTGFVIEEVEYGPGLFVDYFSDYDDSEYIKNVMECISIHLKSYFVTIEAGRYLSYSCGSYYTSVVDKKNTGKNNYAIVDGGIHHINYYGQLLGIKVPPIVVHSSKMAISDVQEYVVCGSLCSVNDILIKKWCGSVEIGDVFEFKKAGAYSCTEASGLFLSRQLPAIVLLKEKEIILKRNHLETYLINK